MEDAKVAGQDFITVVTSSLGLVIADNNIDLTSGHLLGNLLTSQSPQEPLRGLLEVVQVP